MRHPTKLGTSYGLRFSYRGEKTYHHFGGSWEGWSEERAEDERAYVMGQVARGEYVPLRPPAAPAPAEDELPRFQVFASIVLARKRRRVEDMTYKDLEWRLTTAMEHFGKYRVDQIDTGLADDFVEMKLHERESIEKAAAAGRPLMERYTEPRTGRTHQRRRRSLSNDSINKVLAGVRQVLKEAKRRRLIDHNPLDDRECYLRSEAPNRSFLEVPQIGAVLDAARQLDDEQRPLAWRDVRAIRSSEEPATRLAARYGVSDTLVRRIRRGEIWTDERPRESGRLPVVATLLLAGPRILELSKLDRPDLDLAAREIRMPRVKTDASERSVPMLPALHEILLTQSAERRSHQGPGLPDSHRHPPAAGQHPLAAPGRRPGARERAPRRCRRPAYRAHDPTHAAAHVRLAAGRDRRKPAARDVPARPHRPEVHDARLPAGSGSRCSGSRAARARTRLYGRRGVLAAVGPRAPDPRSPRGTRGRFPALNARHASRPDARSRGRHPSAADVPDRARNDRAGDPLNAATARV